MYNIITTQNKTHTRDKYFETGQKVESPKDFSTQKTVLFGIIALSSVLLLNVPMLIQGTYAYGTSSDEFFDESVETRNLVRNSFIKNVDGTERPVNSTDSDEFKLLDERSDKRNSFSYEHPNKINEKTEYVKADVVSKR